MLSDNSQKSNSASAVAERQPPKKQPRPSGKPANSRPRQAAPAEASILKKMQNFRVEFGPSSRDIQSFTTQLAVMVRAGISLQDSLQAIGERQKNQKFQGVILDIKSRIEGGQSLSQALAEHSRVFSNLYINMIAAAEISGSLSGMLDKLAEYLDRDADTKSQIKGAMVYPIIIATMAISVTTFLLCFVLPKFAAIFDGKEHLLPGSTKLLMATSIFLRSYWYFLVLGIAAGMGGLFYFISTDLGRRCWDKAKLVMPLIKTLCRCIYITRSLHTMGVLVRAGVPILNTLSITAQIAGNVHYKDMWLKVHKDVKEGKKIAPSLTRCNLMPSEVIQMIGSGEESGTLSEVLHDVSEYYTRELKTIIKMVTSMIEPIMIVLMGVLVGFIAMSVILPIFKMSSAVTGG